MVVYKITNLLNGKIYVGQTTQPIEKRFIQHSYANSPLGQAMRDCGLENFTIEVIEKCESPAQLNEREKFWIKVLNSKKPNGYNLSDGISFRKNLNSTKKLKFSEKTFSVKETADMLGISEFTVRRRIQDGQLSALMDSKKQGYRITEDSVKSFAEKQNLNVGSIWKKDILKFIPVIGGVIAGMDMLNDLKYAQDSTFDNKYQDINDLDVLNAIVERKQAGIDAYNLQIEYQNFKLAQAKLNQIK